MGSQSVTDFSLVKMNRVRNLIKDYSPHSAGAVDQAREIGDAAVGTLRDMAGKVRGVTGAGAALTTPVSQFKLAFESQSVDTGLGLLLTLAEQLKRDPNRVFEKSGVGDRTQPVARLSAFLRDAHTGILTKSQAETESAFAAYEAIPKTIIDVISRAFPREKEPVEVDREKLTKALTKVSREDIVNTYLENVAAALINLVLDATRSRVPPARVEELKEKIREHYVPKLVARLKGHAQAD